MTSRMRNYKTCRFPSSAASPRTANLGFRRLSHGGAIALCLTKTFIPNMRSGAGVGRVLEPACN